MRTTQTNFTLTFTLTFFCFKSRDDTMTESSTSSPLQVRSESSWNMSAAAWLISFSHINGKAVKFTNAARWASRCERPEEWAETHGVLGVWLSAAFSGTDFVLAFPDLKIKLVFYFIFFTFGQDLLKIKPIKSD